MKSGMPEDGQITDLAEVGESATFLESALDRCILPLSDCTQILRRVSLLGAHSFPKQVMILDSSFNETWKPGTPSLDKG